MKKLLYTLILVTTSTLMMGQVPTHFTLSSPSTGILRISVIFDADGAGPVELDNSSITLFIDDSFRTPAPTYTSIQGGNWGEVSMIDNATLTAFCGADAANFAMLQITTAGIANLGSVIAGIPEDLVDINFGTFDGSPVVGYDPTGGDPLSVCVSAAGANNTADIDLDGTGGALPGVGYEDIVFFNGSQSVPIILNDFDVNPRDNKDSDLDWTSEVEINSSHFEIERSSDAKHWEYLNSIDAQGNSNIYTDYRYTDHDAVLVANVDGQLYYRLKMIDLDGSFEYSEVKMVKFTRAGNQIGIFPNPVSHLLNINAELQSDNGLITIKDELGKYIAQYSFTGSQQIDVSQYVPGIYFVEIRNGNGLVIEKIVVTDN